MSRLANVAADVFDTLQRLLQNSTSYSPQALAWGYSGTLNFGNRFNGFRRCAKIFNVSM